jgi:hypothetical protein
MSENPCIGCRAKWKGQEVAAPCCHDSRILVNTNEYRSLFLSLYQRGLVQVEELYRDGEMFFIVYLLGACPYLVQGLCSLHDIGQKPKSCVAAEPGEFHFCVKSPENRYTD